MNSNSEIKSLLQKFVLNQCTPEETNEVIAYYKKNQLTEDFPTVEDIQNLLVEMPKMDKQTADDIFMNILSASKEEETVIEMPERKSNFRKYISIAASVIVLLGIGFFYKQNLSDKVVEPKFDFKSSDIVLQLENGETQILSEHNSAQVKDAKGNIIGNQNGDKIVYENSLDCLLYTSPSPRDRQKSRMPSSA